FLGCAREEERSEVRAPLAIGAEAAKRSASTDSARVEPDEVELRAHLVCVEERPREDRVVDTRPAGPARIQEQGADPMSLIRGRQADDRERDRRAVGPVVIERNLDGS